MKKEEGYRYKYSHRVPRVMSNDDVDKFFDCLRAISKENGGFGGKINVRAKRLKQPDRTVFLFGSDNGLALVDFVVKVFGDTPNPGGYTVTHVFGKDTNDERVADWCRVAKTLLQKEEISFSEEPILQGAKKVTYRFNRPRDSFMFNYMIESGTIDKAAENLRDLRARAEMRAKIRIIPPRKHEPR